MFSSLRTRLWLTYIFLIVTALLVVVGIFFVYLLNNPVVYRQTSQRLEAVQTILLESQSEWADLPQTELKKELKRQDKLFGVRLLVVSSEPKVIADSRAGISPALETRRILRFIRLNQTVTDSQDKPWLFTFHALDNGNYLVTALPRPAATLLSVLTDELLPPFLIGGGLALVLALFLAFWMARWVADPLQRVVSATREFGGGQANMLPLQGPSEIRELVGAFNGMTARVQAGQKSQRDFVANVSHELKTPLTSIQGFSQAILDGTADTPEAQKQSAQVIYDEASRMYRMVLGLLDLARLDAGIADLKREPVDLTVLLNSLGERFRMQSQRNGITLQVQAESLPPITGDDDRLAQVFINLLDNALKFTPSGGLVRVSATSLGDSVEIVVSDTGTGIAAEALPHIFERFYQADASRAGGKHHGAGLGLAIVDEILRAHAGKISVRSAPGRGTEFTIQLPLVHPDASTVIRRKKIERG